MKKLTLNTDDLQVHSFEAATVAKETGTVHAHATYGQWTCGIYCPRTTDPAPSAPCLC